MNLKKYYPFIVPTISLLLVLFLAFRWYSLRTDRDLNDDINQVEIENLTQDEVELVQGVEDVSTVDLEQEGEELASGQVRYKIEDDRTLINVTAVLPEEGDDADYQVWFIASGKRAQQAFSLELTKAGYVGSASVPIDQLPLEVVVTDQVGAAEGEMGVQLLRGVIEADEIAEEELEQDVIDYEESTDDGENN